MERDAMFANRRAECYKDLSDLLINPCNSMQLHKNFNCHFQGTWQADYKIHLEKDVHGDYQGAKRTINKHLVGWLGTHTVKPQEGNSRHWGKEGLPASGTE